MVSLRRMGAMSVSAALLSSLLPLASAIAQWEMPEFLTPHLSGTPVSGRYIVLAKDASVPLEDVLKLYPGSKTRVYEQLGGFAASLDDKTVASLQANPNLIVEPDRIVEAYSHNSAQTIPTGIARIDAELNTTADIDRVDERVNADIAIIDTGSQRTHPDLNVVAQVNFTNELSADDRNGHGTHVAGTAAAKDNNVGVVGVAPGARIWSVKVLDRFGSGYMSDIIEGVDYVTSKASEIEVANMSLGCECTSAALNTAIARSVAAGVVYVVAAGNSGKDAANSSPANHPDVISVSAIADFNGQPGGGAGATCRTDQDDTLADFSNFGSVVDIAAPGVCINSTWKSSDYKIISGTSMASPHVAGAVALYIVSHGKPQNASDVAAVREALKNAGFAQSSSSGFTGDRDSFAESLLNAKDL